MRVLITGASGYIGQHVVRALKGAGREVVALTRRPDALAQFRGNRITIDGRGFSEEPPRDLLHRGMSVIHLAGVRNQPGGRTSEFERVNVRATERLAAASVEAGVERFVNIGTALVYGPEDFVRTDPYLQSKSRALALLEAMLGLPLVSILPTMVIGPAIRGATNRITEHIRFVLRSPLLPLIGRGDAERNLVYIDDVVRAIVRAEGSSVGGRHVVAGEDISNAELDRRVLERCSRRKAVVRIPAAFALAGARLVDRLRRFEPLCGYRQRLRALSLEWPRPPVARSELQEYETPLDDAIERTIRSLIGQ